MGRTAQDIKEDKPVPPIALWRDSGQVGPLQGTGRVLARLPTSLSAGRREVMAIRLTAKGKERLMRSK